MHLHLKCLALIKEIIIDFLYLFFFFSVFDIPNAIFRIMRIY